MKTKKPEAAGRGRLKLALLAAFFLVPVAGSWVAWRYELVPGTVGNYGTLLPPRAVKLPRSEEHSLNSSHLRLSRMPSSA